jgi:hypothetical protein
MRSVKLLVTATLLLNFVFVRPCFSQSSAASALWVLATDNAPTVSGGITATNQALGSQFAGISYGSTFGGVAGWQRTATVAYLPFAYNANAYVQYSLTPAAGKSFTATSIEMGALGGSTASARMAIYYSTDGFATSLPAGPVTYNGTVYAGTLATSVALLNTTTTPLTGQQVATVPTSILVLPSQTLSIRVYVWTTGTGDRYFASHNVKIAGVTTDALLPLHLLHFSAQSSGNRNRLFWNTTDESNMYAYNLERSTDGLKFNPIGKVEAQNATTNSYSMVDYASSSTTYYRLKMISKDGSFSNSFTIAVNNKISTAVALYPNPAKDFITVSHPPAETNQSLQIVSSEGKFIRQIRLTATTTQTSLSISSLQPGTYMINYANGKEKQTLKLLKN